MARLEFNKLRFISKQLISYQYPGYPFSIYGIIDFKDKCYWLNNNSRICKITDWKNFIKDFDSQLLYHIVDSCFTARGNFLMDQHMSHYKEILKGTSDDFYIDNFNLIKLYFAVYSAIKEYKNSKKIMWFLYDGDSEYIDILLFNTIKEIKEYQNKYINEK